MSTNERKYPNGHWMSIGLSSATRRIHDGQTIAVDGSAGTVEWIGSYFCLQALKFGAGSPSSRAAP